MKQRGLLPPRRAKLEPESAQPRRGGVSWPAPDAAPPVDRRAASGAAGVMSEAVARGIEQSRAHGVPLTDPLARRMEAAFGADFSQVRLHVDGTADALNGALGARAFTSGRDIYFRRGQYCPESRTSRELLAHELTHVLQQGRAESSPSTDVVQRRCSACEEEEQVQAKLRIGSPDDAFEREADAMAASISRELEGAVGLPAARRSPTQVTGRMLQPLLELGGRMVSAESFDATYAELEAVHLVDLIEGARARFPFVARPAAYVRNLLRSIVTDMQQAGDVLHYDSPSELAADVRRRALTSLHFRESQGSAASEAFAYPDRPGDRTRGCGPRVNAAAQSYWRPAPPEPGERYRFELTDLGREHAYQAIVTLFTPQADPCRRTLIHCDYLASLVEYRALAESMGVGRFEAGVQSKLIPLVLKWNGFEDLSRDWVRSSSEAPGSPAERIDAPLSYIPIASEDDLIIGDHVVFYNHESYDALAGRGPETRREPAVWRLENAIVVDRRGGRNRYQGHGYRHPVTANVLVHGMLRQYNLHVAAALGYIRRRDFAGLKREYPNVQQRGTDWVIRGKNTCGREVLRLLEPLRSVPNPLAHPCTGAIYARRPSESR